MQLLELWGGLFYLLNKVLFCALEKAEPENKQKWQKLAWAAYLLGVPAWVFILISERNWIAPAVESGGIPSMLMGFLRGSRVTTSTMNWLSHLAKGSAGLGLLISVWDFGGIQHFQQVIEIFLAAGFLCGTYLTAKGSKSGYFWLIFANFCCAALTGQQGYYFLMSQQLVSVVIISYAIHARSTVS